MPNYKHMANGRLRTNVMRERKLLSDIQKHLPNSYILTNESKKLTLVLPSKHTLALVDPNEVYEDATFVFSMSSADKSAAGVAANVKRKLSSLLQQMQDNEVEKS